MITGYERYCISVSPTTRGRPPRPELDTVILEQTLAQLEQVGYDELRVKDVAAAAGVGLGAIYRRWPGKRELVHAALRTAAGHREPAMSDGDDREAITAGLLRIGAAMREGLGQLIAECLKRPGTEFARIATVAKFAPMTAAVTEMLERLDPARDDAGTRAEAGIGLIVWHAVLTGEPVDEAYVRDHVLPAMGVAPTA